MTLDVTHRGKRYTFSINRLSTKIEQFGHFYQNLSGINSNDICHFGVSALINGDLNFPPKRPNT